MDSAGKTTGFSDLEGLPADNGKFSLLLADLSHPRPSGAHTALPLRRGAPSPQQDLPQLGHIGGDLCRSGALQLRPVAIAE